jgi:S-adenosylmethionine decarboxylase
MESASAAAGIEWVVEAYGCHSDLLREVKRVEALDETVRRELSFKLAAPVSVYQFPNPGGVTVLSLLKESHVAVHTFPEHGLLCLNVFCCRPRPEWDFVGYLKREFGARSVHVRRLERPFQQP